MNLSARGSVSSPNCSGMLLEAPALETSQKLRLQLTCITRLEDTVEDGQDLFLVFGEVHSEWEIVASVVG